MAAVLLLSTTLAAPAGATTALTGVQSVTSDGASYCALLPSGHVDCWGGGRYGQLGNGKFYSVSKGKTGPTGLPGSAVPVAVKGVGGTGTLGGVASLTGEGGGYCALLISGKVDCWGEDLYGELGNGKFYTTGNEGSAVPVAVKGVGGTGTLGGVTGLFASYPGFCALLTSRHVDCWGGGRYGQLGNGKLYTTGNEGSAVPVAVKGVGGTGTLGGVAGLFAKYSGFCALLTSGHLDCWGDGQYGGLGDGSMKTSAVPVVVKGVGGTGTLGGVVGLTSDQGNSDSCALLTSGAVDCWGEGGQGQLGNGKFLTCKSGGRCSGYETAVPVAVKGIGGSGTLGAVTSLTSEQFGYCALLTSGNVDCWGYGYTGELGNGMFYPAGGPETIPGSALPVAVEAVGGTGTLSGVTSLTSDGFGYCALLTSGNIDCWGLGQGGVLGNGNFYSGVSSPSEEGSAVPVAVEGAGGTGTLGGVTGLTTDGQGYCALLTSVNADCWGSGQDGALGNGTFYSGDPFGSAVPVTVVS